MYSQKQLKAFADFLRLPAYRQVEVLFGTKLKWYQKISICVTTRWWRAWRRANPEMDAFDLWESIYKQRF